MMMIQMEELSVVELLRHYAKDYDFAYMIRPTIQRELERRIKATVDPMAAIKPVTDMEQEELEKYFFVQKWESMTACWRRNQAAGELRRRNDASAESKAPLSGMGLECLEQQFGIAMHANGGPRMMEIHEELQRRLASKPTGGISEWPQ